MNIFSGITDQRTRSSLKESITIAWISSLSFSLITLSSPRTNCKRTTNKPQTSWTCSGNCLNSILTLNPPKMRRYSQNKEMQKLTSPSLVTISSTKRRRSSSSCFNISLEYLRTWLLGLLSTQMKEQGSQLSKPGVSLHILTKVSSDISVSTTTCWKIRSLAKLKGSTFRELNRIGASPLVLPWH